MCGIFGLSINNKENRSLNKIKDSLFHLASSSESRGKDSSGFAFFDSANQIISVLKSDLPVTELTNQSEFKNLFQNSIRSFNRGNLFSFIGHSRLVTNGTQTLSHNNQPVVKDGIVSIHNGIIVNDSKIWEKYSNLERSFLIDTEILNSLISLNKKKSLSLPESVINSIEEVQGTVSMAFYSKDSNSVSLYTNNGSLYFLTDNSSYLAFASEKYILNQLINIYPELYDESEILNLEPGKGAIFDLENFESNFFSKESKVGKSKFYSNKQNFKIEEYSIKSNTRDSLVLDFQSNDSTVSKYEKLQLEYNVKETKKLKRCKRCILPETFPFISFDSQCICNYCKNYIPKKNKYHLNDFKLIVDNYRSRDDSPDCIIPFSGGRDSTFALHYIKKELDLNPITFTYDWGMVTDLARRNIARVCGKLGIENIIVAPNIHTKRNYIRKNVLAWLKRPSLGMVPLFMAGDKQFFYYTQKLKEQTNLKLNIWGINELENTDFKSGFGGVSPEFSKTSIYSLSVQQNLSLFYYIMSNLIRTPEYINDSLIDNLKGHWSRLKHPREDFYNFFDFYEWDEEEINSTIISEYNWETAIDTSSTWRIGDGTASFYNYIYFTVAGFSEIDTFRSNQIREGMINRDEALSLALDENRPRYENLKWYLEIIGVDFSSAIKRINQIPKLYNI